MEVAPPEQRSAKTYPREKNRVWGKNPPRQKFAYKIEPQALELHRKNGARSTKVASGVLYYGYRYYSPGSGRWLSRDPIGERGGVNLYGMVGNDGVNRVDFLGLSPKAPDCCKSELAKVKKHSVAYNNIKSRLDNLQNKMDKRLDDLATNPQNLPFEAPPGSTPRHSVEGHIQEIMKDMQRIDDRFDDLKRQKGFLENAVRKYIECVGKMGPDCFCCGPATVKETTGSRIIHGAAKTVVAVSGAGIVVIGGTVAGSCIVFPVLALQAAQ